MLEKIKARLGLVESLTVYDAEIEALIEHAKFDMLESGVPSELIDAEGAAVLNTITFFVKREFEDDITKAQRYDKLYNDSVFRLNLFNMEGYEDDD